MSPDTKSTQVVPFMLACIRQSILVFVEGITEVLFHAVVEIVCLAHVLVLLGAVVTHQLVPFVLFFGLGLVGIDAELFSTVRTG